MAKEYATAAIAWEADANVAGVRYCYGSYDEVCASKRGGYYDFASRLIFIDHDFKFPRDGELATMIHEYGHALGLNHVNGYSVMRQGWEEPYPIWPTKEDIERARNRAQGH